MSYIRNTVTGQTVWHDPKENYVLQANEVDIGNTYIPPVFVTPDPHALTVAARVHLDAAAQRKGYADAADCVSYINSTVLTIKADAVAMNQWRDDSRGYINAQLALATLPAEAALLTGIDALASNPKW